MNGLTEDRPKPMVEIRGKNLIQHKIDALPLEIDEVVIVVHHMKEVIMNFFGSKYNGRKIIYVDQGEPHGTGHALFSAKDALNEDFICMFGDDIYDAVDIREVIKYPWALTVTPKKSFKDAFNIVSDERGYMKEIICDAEGTADIVMLDIGLYKFKKDIFNTPLVPLKSKPSEYGLPHTLFAFAEKTAIPLKVITAHSWHMLNTPEEVLIAEKILSQS